jgi:hypothetical protein
MLTSPRPVTLGRRKPLRNVTPSSTDGRVLGDLIRLDFAEPPHILDASWGRGGMWRGCAYQPSIRLDKRPLPGVDVVGDWNALGELFASASLQVIVWDPPHQTDGGDHALGGDWSDRYGTADPVLRGHANIAHLFAPLLAAARTVLEPRGGMLIAKIADQVHNDLQQLQAVDFVNTARAAGWDVCHLEPVWTGTKPVDPKWRRQKRLRKSSCYFIVAHPERCRPVGIVLKERCPFCGDDYVPRRTDQRTCGRARCRQRRAREARVARQGWPAASEFSPYC